MKRKLHVIGGGRGVWSLPVRQAVKVNGTTFERASNPHYGGNDAVIISTDANPSPGLSRVCSLAIMPLGARVLISVSDRDTFHEDRHIHYDPHTGHDDRRGAVLPGNGDPACYVECDSCP